VAVAIAVAVVGCGIAATIKSLDFGELPANFDYRGDEISASRADQIRVLEGQLDAVERRSGFEYVGPRGRLDRCEVGQDNFTRRDTYAYTCRAEIVQVMAIPEPFRSNASRLGEALLEGDCPDGTDTDRALAEGFHHIQDLDATSGDCTPGYFESEGARISGWLPAHPNPEQLERATFDLPPTCYPWYERELCDETVLDLRKAVAAAPTGTAYLAIVDAGEFQFYYEVPWD
jgi:hypothetical protein